MANELRISTTKPLIKAQILNEAGEMWNGSAMVEESTFADKPAWRAALVTLIQGALGDATVTILWREDWPNDFPKDAIYTVVFFSGASPSPGDEHIGQQDDPTEYRTRIAPTAAEIQAEMEENGESILDTLRDDLADDGRLDVIIDAILADTNELQTDWADGGRLDVLLDSVSGGAAGSGARTVAVTVDDGSDALENATVRFTEGGNTYVGSTDASGEISFSLDDATYALAISKPGYSFTPTALVVDGDEAETYSMTAESFPEPADPGQVTGYLYCYDEDGAVEDGVDISIIQVDVAVATGYAYDDTTRVETSDAGGRVLFTGLFKGARYRLLRGDTATTFVCTIPDDADSPYELTSILGKP